MESQTYNISKVTRYTFEFRSIGKERLLKQVVFTNMESNANVYNLSLGTVMRGGSVDFRDSSNNGDMVKVFSTIVKCIRMFTSDFPHAVIFFQGNTEQKTRVYNEILRRHYEEFSLNFNIFGVRVTDGNTTVQKFDKRRNYSGFYLTMKN